MAPSSRPDSPLVPTDASYLAIAENPAAPMVAATSSDFGLLKASYVFAYARMDPAEAVFSPESLGIAGHLFPQSLVYDFFAQTGEIVPSAADIRRTVDSEAPTSSSCPSDRRARGVLAVAAVCGR